MTCPSCQKQATSLVRNTLTYQGVSLVQAMKGMLRCQYCGTLLKITNYGPYFWYAYIPAVIAVSLLVIGHLYLHDTFGIDPGVLGISLMVMIFVTFVYGMWRNANVEQVEQTTNAGS